MEEARLHSFAAIEIKAMEKVSLRPPACAAAAPPPDGTIRCTHCGATPPPSSWCGLENSVGSSGRRAAPADSGGPLGGGLPRSAAVSTRETSIRVTNGVAEDSGSLGGLRTSLPDAHHIRGQTFDLADVDQGAATWKFFCEHMMQVGCHVTTLSTQLTDLESEMTRFRHEWHRNDVTNLRQDLTNAWTQDRDTIFSEIRQIAEQVTGMTQLVRAEKNQRESFLNKTEKMMQAVFEAERKAREALEERLIAALASLSERVNAAGGETRVLLEDQLATFQKLTAEVGSDSVVQLRQVNRTLLDLEATISAASSRARDVDDRCTSLESRLADGISRQGAQVNRISERQELLLQNFEGIRLQDKQQHNQIQADLDSVRKDMTMLHESQEQASHRLHSERNQFEEQIRRVQQALQTELVARFTAVEAEISERLERQSYARERTVRELFGEVSPPSADCIAANSAAILSLHDPLLRSPAVPIQFGNAEPASWEPVSLAAPMAQERLQLSARSGTPNKTSPQPCSARLEAPESSRTARLSAAAASLQPASGESGAWAGEMPARQCASPVRKRASSPPPASVMSEPSASSHLAESTTPRQPSQPIYELRAHSPPPVTVATAAQARPVSPARRAGSPVRACSGPGMPRSRSMLLVGGGPMLLGQAFNVGGVPVRSGSCSRLDSVASSAPRSLPAAAPSSTACCPTTSLAAAAAIAGAAHSGIVVKAASASAPAARGTSAPVGLQFKWPHGGHVPQVCQAGKTT